MILYAYDFFSFFFSLILIIINSILVKRKPQNSKIFNKIVKSYKTSVANTLPYAYTMLKNVMADAAPGYVVYGQRNAATSRSKDLSELRYFE